MSVPEKMNTERCSICGKFCIPYDSGVQYGSYYDLEPPEEEMFCKQCYDKKIAEPKKVIIGCWWIKPNYVSIAKSILRHQRSAG